MTFTATELTAKDAREFLEYNPNTGIFLWRVDRNNRTKAGSEAGNTSYFGYRVISVNGINYKAHRLAWLITYEYWPETALDHINHVRTDNRIANLALSSVELNMKNKSKYANNKSGVTGITWNKHMEKWEARIGISGQRHFLGLFDRKQEAVSARKKAEAQYGFHPNHGGDI